mgnify:CR=1 FL=1
MSKPNITLWDGGSFSDSFGKGTVSEQRDKKTSKPDAAGIINASANGLDSVSNFISMFTGTATTNNPTEPIINPQTETARRPNPWLIGGIVGGAILLIAFLIYLKNGAKQK